ncbi:hypothetical protein B0H11DRAFT_1960031 [Mycena galericulata]|nr:hypothetical protein B0H11DRAFT_1960031 [Mycena galericulata]
MIRPSFTPTPARCGTSTRPTTQLPLQWPHFTALGQPHDPIQARAPRTKKLALTFSDAVILQNDFPLLSGRVEVKVPWVGNSDQYQLVLFGDSGNFSPYFTINGSGLEI